MQRGNDATVLSPTPAPTLGSSANVHSSAAADGNLLECSASKERNPFPVWREEGICGTSRLWQLSGVGLIQLSCEQLPARYINNARAVGRKNDVGCLLAKINIQPHQRLQFSP